MMWYWNGGMHWWVWLVGLAGMVAFWGVVVWVVWAVLAGPGARSVPSGSESRPPAPGARQILDERLARGEIDVDEYRRLVEALRSGGGSHEDRGAGVGGSVR